MTLLGRVLRMPRPKPHPLLDALRAIERRLNQLKEIMVANFDALNQRLDTLTASLEAAQARIAEDFQALKDQLASDSADQAAIDAAVAKLDQSIALLDSVDPDAANPPVA